MSISGKQIGVLFAANIVIWTIIQGFIIMLPVYALRLGAEAAAIGNYLALSFLALTVGGMLAGWLADRFQRRKMLLLGTVILSTPVTWLLSQVTTFEQLVIVTAAVFFLFSFAFSLIIILAGLSAGVAQRGKVFGTLAVAGPIGSLVAGSFSGVIVNRWSFEALFLVGALCWLVALVILLLVEDKPVARPEAGTPAPPRQPLGWLFYLMLLANLLAFGCGFIALLGRPLQMDGLGFDPEAISGVVAIGGAVSIPLPFLLGWLSDRVSRYYVVAFCFLIGALGLFVLAASDVLWLFIVSAMLMTTVGASLGISQALITDLVPTRSLGVALSLYSASVQMGGVIGFGSAGNAIQTFGLASTYIAGGVLTLIGMGLLLLVQSARRRAPALA